MKFKWFFPFLPFFMIFISDPYVQRSMEGRWLAVAGGLAATVGLLVVIKPWHRDDGTRR